MTATGTGARVAAGETGSVPGTRSDGETGAVATTDTAPDTVRQEGRIVGEVRRELSILRETHYQHATHVRESQGVFDVDCSGFLNYVLRHAAPSNFDAIVNATRARPLAADYVSFLDAPPVDSGWLAVQRVSDLEAGDIVAWLAPPTSDDTGHVMIVRSPPQRRDATSFIVSVWDSVALPHGVTDSRSATNSTGIGYGDVVLLVDADGAPTGHEWFDGGAQITERTSLGRLRYGVDA